MKERNPIIDEMAKIRPDQPVPMDDWGKDHWSFLGYIHSRCVEYKGVLDENHLRANPERHPFIERSYHLTDHSWDPKYGTRLKGFFEDETRILPWHDDMDCLDDLEIAGLVTQGTKVNPFAQLTEKGEKYASALMIHKARGGNFADFDFRAVH